MDRLVAVLLSILMIMFLAIAALVAFDRYEAADCSCNMVKNHECRR